MSQDHPNSTPRRSFPKPILSAFGSTGSLQRKTRVLAEKNTTSLASSYTPETPLKTERSKFIVPSNLSPFALSPKLLMARNWSINKPTDLRNESLLNINFNSDSFESGYLNSPSHFSSSTIDDINHLGMEEESLAQNGNIFLDIKTNFCSDHEIDSFSISPSIDSEFAPDSEFVPHDEPWKSSRVNFLNNWKQSEDAFGKIIFQKLLIHSYFLACYGYENLFEFSEYSDYFADNFEILELIGHGGFSVVYKVRSKRDDQIFALKKTKSPFKGNSDR